MTADSETETETSSPAGQRMMEKVVETAFDGEGQLSPEEDQQLIERLNAEVMAESGVPLDQLINPSKVVNAGRDLIILGRQLEVTNDASERDVIQQKMDKKNLVLLQEKKAVMQNWLKNLFVGQSVVAGVVSLALVYQVIPADLSVQVLGFWMWWLFIIPSLRARKPKTEEKEALNWAFLATPLVSIVMPTFTKDVALIWWGNAAATAACYAYAYLKPASTTDDQGPDGEGGMEDVQQGMAPMLIKVFKALDYGSGQERGARK